MSEFSDEDVKALLTAAKDTSANAHAPYSRYRVGAVIQARDGRVFSGCNVENASYGLTVCAERVAVFLAVAGKCRDFVAAGVVSTSATVPFPCGACRQVLAEFCSADFSIFVAAEDNLEAYQALTLGELLPNAFSM